MKALTLTQIINSVGGKCDGDANVLISGVYTDSRNPIKDGLFIALEGDKFDGHDFVKNAEKDGAAAVICRKKVNVSIPVIYVSDTRRALMDLASCYRGLFRIPVVGLTGSVGKTTTKEMTPLVLSSQFNTVKTKGNLNNDIGMPLTLFTIDDTTEAAVIEMGMNHKGEISRLTSVSRPDIGMITNIGVSHIENLGSRENILAAKLEILDGMKKGSPLILNGDDDMLSGVVNDDYDITFFGIDNENCQVRAADIVSSADGTKCNILYNGGRYETFIPAAGLHNVYDALAAFTAGVKLGISPENAAHALREYVPAGMRQKITVKNDITFIEDCYNASPDSVKAGLNTLTAMNAKRYIAVLGDMLELGDYSEKAHRICGEYAAGKGVDILFAYGRESVRYTADSAGKGGISEVYGFIDEAEAAEKLSSLLRAGDVVLFKASRGMKLENIMNSVYKNLSV